MKLVKVDPKEVPNQHGGRRGRVAYPIVNAFLQSDMYVAKLTDLQRPKGNVYQAIRGYVRKHDMPVEAFMRDGELYLVRKDINEDGTPNEEWQRTHTDEGTETLPEIGEGVE